MNAPAFTGWRWYAKRGVSQMVSEDTTIWTAPSQNTDGSRWFVFADADEHGENEATANLIAAAPRMYAALESFLDNPRPGQTFKQFVRSTARAALSEARGESA